LFNIVYLFLNLKIFICIIIMKLEFNNTKINTPILSTKKDFENRLKAKNSSIIAIIIVVILLFLFIISIKSNIKLLLTLTITLVLLLIFLRFYIFFREIHRENPF